MSGKSGWFSSLFGSGSDPKPPSRPASKLVPAPASAHPASKSGEHKSETEASGEPALISASHTQPEWPEGSGLLEDFKIEKILGSGAQGLVYSVLSISEGRRYAVKRIKFKDAESQRNIMDELQSWIYLPEHPHLAACRFARTWGNEIDIFIERINGQKLDEWVNTGKIYEGGHKRALERILDIAIQYAWGLNAIHEMHLIHGDARPRNIFVAESGLAKITDIGLTRALAYGSTVGGKVVANNVTTEKLSTTPCLDYRSPEQQQGKEISLATDTWSWGVSVLQMFVGNQNWPAEPLEQFVDTYLKTGPQDKNFPPLPPEVAEVLKKCFHSDPKQRWQFLSHPTEPLKKLYQTLVNKPYPRSLPAKLHRGSMLSIAHARWSPGGGVQWTEPAEWDVRIQHATGKKDLQRPKLTGARFSKKVQGQSDLPSYVRLQGIFDKLIESGQKDLDYEYALFCFDKAFVHAGLDDLPSTLACFDKSIEIFERLVNKEGREELANDLAMCYLNRAIALKHRGEFSTALPIYEQAMATWDRLVNKESRRELAGNLAWVQALCAEVLFNLADHTRAHADFLSKQAQLKKEFGNTPPPLQKKVGAASSAQLPMLTQTPPQKKETGSTSSAQLPLQPPPPPPDPKKQAEDLAMEIREMIKTAQLETQEARELQKKGQDIARNALKLLQSEVLRTNREDLRAIQHWAIQLFDGLL